MKKIKYGALSFIVITVIFSAEKIICSAMQKDLQDLPLWIHEEGEKIYHWMIWSAFCAFQPSTSKVLI